MDCRSAEQSVLMKFEESLRRSLDEFPNCLEVNILCQPSASRPYGPEPLFVNIAACTTKDWLMSSYVIECNGLNGPCRRVSDEDSSGSECFCFSKSRVLLDKERIPFDILFVNSFKALFTFPFSLEI